MKAATPHVRYGYTRIRISIHAAREGGDGCAQADKCRVIISIHAAREGGDFASPCHQSSVIKFQSTPPVKAATAGWKALGYSVKISIHAAREGGDNARIAANGLMHDFNPRRP